MSGEKLLKDILKQHLLQRVMGDDGQLGTLIENQFQLPKDREQQQQY